MAPEPIRSRSNAIVKRLRALKASSAEAGLCLLEGIKLVEEALAAGVPIEEVAAVPSLEDSERGRALLTALTAIGERVRWLDESVLASLSDAETSQGVLALARRPHFDEERLFAGVPLVVVAAGVQNPGNVGALLRTAEAAGATGAYLASGTADAFSWKSLRGSMGSAFRLPSVREDSLDEVLRRLRSRDVETIAASPRGAAAYDAVDLRGPAAFLFGGEGAGLPDHVTARADRQVMIPMRGAVESLNVGVAAGVLLFEAARQRRR